jgi:transcriptional regulator
MYIPRANEEKRIPVMHALIKSQPLAALVTLGADGLLASHIPMILEEDGSEFGILKGHVSRANTQWRDRIQSVDALAIFAGPHHYISPSWYPEKQEHGKVVPTWNYAVVHAYGPLTVVDDGQWLLAHLQTLTNTHEAVLPSSWKVSDAPEEFIRSMMEGIVGLELPIKRLEGKWKVSQNRSQADREGVVEGLGSLNTPESLALKALVEEALREE